MMLDKYRNYNFQNFNDDPQHDTNENINYSNDNELQIVEPRNIKQIDTDTAGGEQNQITEQYGTVNPNHDLYTSVSSVSSAQKLQDEYLQKVKRMENLIDIIKGNAYQKFKDELESKLQYKNELENRVEILSSYIRLNRVHQKNFGLLTKNYTNENDRLISSSVRCQDEDFFLSQNLMELRRDINQMQNAICQNNEQTKTYRNEKLQIERSIMSLEDDIKKLNLLTTNIQKEREGLKNSIKLLKTHSQSTKEKIQKQDGKTDEFLNNLTLLAIDTQKQNEEYEKKNSKYNKTSRISTAESVKKSKTKKF